MTLASGEKFCCHAMMKKLFMYESNDVMRKEKNIFDAAQFRFLIMTLFNSNFMITDHIQMGNHDDGKWCKKLHRMNVSSKIIHDEFRIAPLLLLLFPFVQWDVIMSIRTYTVLLRCFSHSPVIDMHRNWKIISKGTFFVWLLLFIHRLFVDKF